MEYEFRHNETTIKLETEIDSQSGKLKAILNDRVVEAAITSILQNQVNIDIDGRNHKAFVVSDDARSLIYIEGQIVELVSTDSERKSFSTGDHDFGARDHVVSPMPGKVVKILVSVGESVTARQPLVIVESMKMENEIKSPAAGKIKEIKFAAGDLVGTGQPIILLEPEE
jgi:biotin carboxyl carrier protein